MILLSIVTLASGRGLPWSTARINNTPISPDSSTLQQSRSNLIEAEVITVTKRGFEPASITRPQGEFTLMIENATLENLDLRLAREAGERLHEIRPSREQPDWNELMDLRPGRYVLTELNHPQWTCL